MDVPSGSARESPGPVLLFPFTAGPVAISFPAASVSCLIDFFSILRFVCSLGFATFFIQISNIFSIGFSMSSSFRTFSDFVFRSSDLGCFGGILSNKFSCFFKFLFQLSRLGYISGCPSPQSFFSNPILRGCPPRFIFVSESCIAQWKQGLSEIPGIPVSPY